MNITMNRTIFRLILLSILSTTMAFVGIAAQKAAVETQISDGNEVGSQVVGDIRAICKNSMINFLATNELIAWDELKNRFEKAKKDIEIFGLQYKDELSGLKAQKEEIKPALQAPAANQDIMPDMMPSSMPAVSSVSVETPIMAPAPMEAPAPMPSPVEAPVANTDFVGVLSPAPAPVVEPASMQIPVDSAPVMEAPNMNPTPMEIPVTQPEVTSPAVPNHMDAMPGMPQAGQTMLDMPTK